VSDPQSTLFDIEPVRDNKPIKKERDKTESEIRRAIHRNIAKIANIEGHIESLKQLRRKTLKRHELLNFQLFIHRSRLKNPPPDKHEDKTGWPEWQDVPTCKLKIDKIPGVGIKRAKMLVIGFPTIGELERLRITEGISSIPGFSQILRRRIEEKLLTWLGKNATSYQRPRSAEHDSKRVASSRIVLAPARRKIP
jgi:hypothetical protein